MDAARRRALLQIHFCVLLWGFTAILGKLISLAALPLVWWRMLVVCGSLLLVKAFWRGLREMTRKLIFIFCGIGCIVALHWLTFYASIKLSNASVAATCMALAPVFIAFVEPLVVRRRFDMTELLFGLSVIPGVALVVGGTPSGMRLGIAVGVLSAFFVAVFSSLNKRYIASSSVLTITGIEMGAGALFLTAASGLFPGTPLFVVPEWRDALLLLVLSFGCTSLPFALSLVALKQLSAFSTALAVNLEPIYSIVLAILLFGEQRELGVSFYVGVAILLLVVFTHPLWAERAATRRATAATSPAARDANAAAAADRPDRGTNGSA
jgi:drug/metabolite transporter (DMT)-like permease